MGRWPSAEGAARMDLLRQCVEEGWPLIEITRTHGFDFRTIRKYFPDYRGLPLKEASQLGVQARRTNRSIRQNVLTYQESGHAQVENP